MLKWFGKQDSRGKIQEARLKRQDLRTLRHSTELLLKSLQSLKSPGLAYVSREPLNFWSLELLITWSLELLIIWSFDLLIFWPPDLFPKKTPLTWCAGLFYLLPDTIQVSLGAVSGVKLQAKNALFSSPVQVPKTGWQMAPGTIQLEKSIKK